MRDRRSFEERFRCLDDPPPAAEKPLVVPDLETHLRERRVPMASAYLILMVLAFACLGLAAFGVTGHPRVNLGWLGLALWVLAIIIPRG